MDDKIKIFTELSKLFPSLIPLKGKRPVIKEWQQWCTQHREFDAKEYKDRNCGIPCGPANGIIVIDVDDVAAFEDMRMKNGWDLPKTRTHETGTGKPHYFYKYPEGTTVYGCKSKKDPETRGSIFDIRGLGGQVVAPSSIHPDTGKPYTIKDDRKIVDAPQWLLDLSIQASEHDSPTIDDPWDGSLESLSVNLGTKKLIEVGEEKGKRSEAIISVVNSLVHAGLTDEAIFGVFEKFAIGEKYREKGDSKQKWLQQIIKKAGGTVNDVIRTLNESHAVILNLGEGQCVVLNEKINPATGRDDVDFSHFSHFKNRYANRNVTVTDARGRGTKKNIAQLWIHSPSRREYQGVVFSPGKEVPGYYNLYKGFGVDPKPGDWSLLQKHIREVIASGNQQWFDYLMAWMARIVQDPGGERPGVAVVMRGERGCGKGSFATTFGELFGIDFLPIQNQNLFHGRFNAHFKNCILAFVDEAVWAGEKSSEGAIKALITERTITCEQKFKDPLTVQNHTNFIIASNNQWVIPAGPKERRFFVLDVPGTRTGDRVYFNALFKQINDGGREAMLYDLQRHDLSRINLRDFPKTDALLDQIERSFTITGKFWITRLREVDWTWGDSKPIETGSFYMDFQNYCEKLSERYLPAINLFMKEIKMMCPGLKRLRPKKGSRVQVIQFPPLEECRKQFEVYIGFKISWSKEIDGEVDYQSLF